MKIGILSYRSEGRSAAPEELRLQSIARKKGHTARIFRVHRFQMVFSEGAPRLVYDGKPFPKYDVVIVRPSILNNVDLRASIIEQMELNGLLVFNRFEPIMKAKNKLKTMQILDHYGIPIPKTAIVHREEDLKQACKTVGGFPVILKRPVGSFGKGVSIIESMRGLKSTLLWKQPMYILQRYVKDSKGTDIRIFIVNGKVVGTMQRKAQKGEFRSNIELGGRSSKVQITDEEANIAIRSVQALDLDYGGVDLMRSKNGPVVIEVNSNPGFKELEQAAGISIAGALVDHAVELVEKHRL